MKGNEDKIMDVDGSKMFAMAGDAGDRVNFCDYVKRNIKLYELRTGIRLSTHAAANFTRHELANALREDPKNCNLLLAGLDNEHGASLYYLDYLGISLTILIAFLSHLLFIFHFSYPVLKLLFLVNVYICSGTMHKMHFGAHGYASNFVLSIFDRHYKPDLNIEEGLKLAQMCMQTSICSFLHIFLILVPRESDITPSVRIDNMISPFHLFFSLSFLFIMVRYFRNTPTISDSSTRFCH